MIIIRKKYENRSETYPIRSLSKIRKKPAKDLVFSFLSFVAAGEDTFHVHVPTFFYILRTTRGKIPSYANLYRLPRTE